MNSTLLQQGWFLLVLLLPLTAAAALVRRSWRGWVWRMAPWTALPALVTVWVIPLGARVQWPWIFAGSRIGVDELAQGMLGFTAVLWFVSGLFARSYLAGDSRRERFLGFYLLAMSGNFALILAQDILSFYGGFALMSFSAYGLVIHYGGAEALRAGRVYLWLVVIGELAFFAGMVLAAVEADSILIEELGRYSLHSVTVALFWLGFGIKAGALPLHVWLPLAHPAAPVPASAVLSGAMIKAGLIGWLRFLLPYAQAQAEWGAVFMVGGLAAAFYGAAVGLMQDNPKTLLAYSSISQMGLMTLGVGAALSVPEIQPAMRSALIFFAAHHGLTKGALFLGVGVASAIGNSKYRVLIGAGMVLAALSLAGMPLTSGAVAKSLLKSELAYLPDFWNASVKGIMPLATASTTMLMMRYLILLFRIKPASDGSGLALGWPLGLLILIGMSFSWFWPETPTAARESLDPSTIWKGIWPIGIGLLAGWVGWRWPRRLGLEMGCRIPPGDILEVVPWLVRRWGRLATCFAGSERSVEPRKPVLRAPRVARWKWGDPEYALRHWAPASLLLAGIILTIYLLLVGGLWLNSGQ